MRILHSILVFSILFVAEGISAQECPQTLPKIIQHAEPFYPPIARTAHIIGDVGVRITTDGESVRTVEAETGPPLLRKVSEDNAKTWKFEPHKPDSFHVTFRYRISSGGTDVEFLKSPGVVELNAPAPETSIYYSGIGLGTWRAQLKNAQGKSSFLLKLSYTGADADWLDVNTVGGNEEDSEESDFGHLERGFLAFILKVNQPGGKRVRTFLIGKMKVNKIVGTFVDEAGVTGEWTAVRTGD
jgi:hypothetical protein